MGIAFLPWERLPAYVFGPLFFAINMWCFVADDDRSLGYSILEIGGMVWAVWIIWARYSTGEEPLWTEEQRQAARQRETDSQ